jgi:hypothetical protein
MINISTDTWGSDPAQQRDMPLLVLTVHQKYFHILYIFKYF